MTRTHKLQYRLAKDRDYVITESRAFFGGLESFLTFLRGQGMGRWPQAAMTILDDLEKAAKAHDLRPLPDLCERARQLAWNTMRTSHEGTGALMLSFLHWLESFSYVWVKEPAEYDRSLRPEGVGP